MACQGFLGLSDFRDFGILEDLAVFSGYSLGAFKLCALGLRGMGFEGVRCVSIWGLRSRTLVSPTEGSGLGFVGTTGFRVSSRR